MHLTAVLGLLVGLVAARLLFVALLCHTSSANRRHAPGREDAGPSASRTTLHDTEPGSPDVEPRH